MRTPLESFAANSRVPKEMRKAVRRDVAISKYPLAIRRYLRRHLESLDQFSLSDRFTLLTADSTSFKSRSFLLELDLCRTYDSLTSRFSKDQITVADNVGIDTKAGRISFMGIS